MWIAFFNGRSGDAVDRLTDLLSDGGAPLGMPDLVLFEVLRGFRDEQDSQAARRAPRAARRTLAALPVVQIGGEDAVLRAAQHYRALRAAGITVHSTIDVLLASYCIEHDHALLHAYRDFDVIERLRGLKVWRH